MSRESPAMPEKGQPADDRGGLAGGKETDLQMADRGQTPRSQQALVQPCRGKPHASPVLTQA